MLFLGNDIIEFDCDSDKSSGGKFDLNLCDNSQKGNNSETYEY